MLFLHPLNCKVLYVPSVLTDRDSVVGIATRYGLVGPGIESRWGRGFPHPSRPALRPTQPPVQWVPGLSWGVKRPGRGADHPPPPKCRGHERVELYLYSPSGPSWPVLGWNFYLYHPKFTFFHSVWMCSSRYLCHTAIISVHSIKQPVVVRDTMCSVWYELHI